MLKRIFFIILISMFLCSCGSGGNGGNDINTDSIETITISTIGSTQTINNPDVINLTIKGSDNQIQVKSDVNELRISGINNYVRLSGKIAIIDLFGNDNEISLPLDSGYSLTDKGIRNIIIEYE